MLSFVIFILFVVPKVFALDGERLRARPRAGSWKEYADCGAPEMKT
jgi:hypothetical protein